MFTISCTARLLKRAGFTPELTHPTPTTALGDWHAHLIYISKYQLLLFVNDLSRLAVLAPAKNARAMRNTLTAGLSSLLERMSIPQRWIDAETCEMAECHYTSSRNRSVLGTMNDYKQQIENSAYESGWIFLTNIEDSLSECPIGPLQYQVPKEVVYHILQKYDSSVHE